MKKKLIIFMMFVLTIVVLSENKDMIKVKETENFIFYSEEIGNYDEIYNCFENGFKTITDDFSLELIEKPSIAIYKSEIALKNDSRYKNLPNVFLGYYDILSHRINIVDINNISTSTKEAKKIFLHEFTHYVTGQIKEFSPKTTWIHEGIAVYENGQITGYGVYEIKMSVKNKEIPEIKEIRESFQNGGFYYTWASNFIEYLIKEFGYKKLKELLENDVDFEKTFNLSEDDIFINWKDYLNKNYGKNNLRK